MHLLMCPSCERRYAVSGAGSLGEWRCTKCSQELAVTNRDLPRLAVMGDVLPVESRTDPKDAVSGA